MQASTDKLLLTALNGGKSRKVPFWLMRQAGRYLPEYRDLRARKSGFLSLVYDPSAACEITMQPIRRFGMDGAILFSDILVIPQALGQKLEFREGEGPHLEPLRSAKDLAALKLDKIHGTLEPIYETVANVRAALKAESFNHVTHIGFAGSPWTVACYMLEGHGSKDFAAAKTVAYCDPIFFTQLIEILIEATAQYLIRQVQAGAETLQLFESWAGISDAGQFERWIIQPTQQLVARLKLACPGIPIIGFPKGTGLHAVTYAEKTGIDALGLDSQTPVVWARDNIQNRIAVQGNLDPFCLLAGGKALENGVNEILETLSDGPFIFNLGHGIHKDTPVGHVEKLTELIKGY